VKREMPTKTFLKLGLGKSLALLDLDKYAWDIACGLLLDPFSSYRIE
jgi:hypothetical protein